MAGDREKPVEVFKAKIIGCDSFTYTDSITDTVFEVANNQITFKNGNNIALQTGTGTKLATATDQKLGFWGATAVAQQVLASGSGASADDIILALQTIGLFKQA